MDINYNHYRMFYYVAKYRNFTRAAAVLMNSQSNITRAIKNMENELGCTLFVRSNRGVRLTPEGEKLYAHIRVAVEQIQAGEEELSTDKTMESGAVSIGTSGVALRCFLLPVLKDFQQRYPKIHVRLSNHSTPQAIAALKSGAVDLALVTTPVGTPKGLKVKTVKQVRTVAVCGKAFGELEGKEISLSKLADYPIVSLGPHTKTHEVYSSWFGQYGLHFSPDIEAYTSDQVLPIVRSNLGIGFVPYEFLDTDETDDVLVLKIKEPLPERAVCFLKREDHTLSIAAKELERMIYAAAQKSGSH
ncbi:MAG: LysR family transcriptional regulator [Clostridia bacterium]|nr:LysR family transcriptional regulator [Clostridia bacterium]